MQARLSQVPGYAGLERLWAVIPTARLVGGCVRDVLCGAEVHDLDLASPLPPEEAQRILEKAGIKVIPTGLSHGTITALIDHSPYEITTLRRDVETDGRHAVVAWTDNWREDAARRDFTINAMSLDREGRVYDYFHGREDLEAKRVRFVGNANHRIEEDALRALRFFRFHARYGADHVDQDAYEAIKQHAHHMGHLSIERIASEILKILAGPQVVRTIRLMEQVGLLHVLLPQATLEGLEHLLACQGTQRALVRLYALSPDPDVGRHLKLSNVDKDALKAFASAQPDVLPTMNDDALRRVLCAQKKDVLRDRTWIQQAKDVAAPSVLWDQLRERIDKMSRPEFPLSGRDGLAVGLEPGPALGRWIKKTRNWWLDHGCRPDREACQAWLREQLSHIE